MTYVRKDLWNLGETWNPTLLWYAKAVRELQSRPLNDPTSWRFLAAIHGFNASIWETEGYYDKKVDKLPSLKDRELYWKQCQHQSWYFLPWHRPYLLSFEEIVRAAVVKLGGPADWALPYWNYDEYQTRPETLGLPEEFYSETLPDGTPNPLALPVVLRFGSQKDGIIRLNPAKLDLTAAFNEDQFTRKENGGSPGFGGPSTGFNHNAGHPSGLLESSPHNFVHTMVGGDNGLPVKDPAFRAGLMSDPDTAGLDPVFWLHHANIDRLWQIWLNRDPSHHNSTKPKFVDGPPLGRPFILPTVNGESRFWKVHETLELKDQPYTYESFYDPVPKAPQEKLAAAAFVAQPTVAAVDEPEVDVELIGANSDTLKLVGRKGDTRVHLDKSGLAKVSRRLAAKSLVAENAAAPKHERIFLNLENIRGQRNAVLIDVYVNLPQGEQPDTHPELHAGSVSLFGVSSASDVNTSHGGSGLSASLEITQVIEVLRQGGDLDLAHLQVSLFPDQNLFDGDDITVGRISIYRQGE
ncbi:tyrosinase family protein [Pseudomonas japonica]|uniref:Tyrosinase n=1 Tax=Pseudomonas japonica TaxID=256466 RepID=A0A239JU18_9PSED|nr:tyrosinase family protein [Pseudomonas japonica]SNT08374.1 tyrosinase [Pseudomonas japonica]